MSISMDRRRLLLVISIIAVPPLKQKGQPERARDSKRENALIDFSISVLLSIGYDAATWSIHASDLLSVCIIIFYIVHIV